MGNTIHIMMGFYILIGILLAPSFTFLEKTYKPKLFYSENRLLVLLSFISYYFLWPVVLIYYVILLIKIYH